MKLSNEVKVGMAVFVAVSIFFAGVMYLRGISFKKSDYSLTIVYGNVGGLRAENPITVAGDTLPGTYQPDLTELTSTLAPISSNVLGILQNVNNTFDEKTRRGLQNILSDDDKATRSSKRSFAARGRSITSSAT
jgi:hypothetical protein